MTPLTLPIPLAWYYAGASEDFKPSACAQIDLPGRSVVVYRGTSGTLHAVQSHCPHMNSPLSKGEVRGESLKCSLHHWIYNNEGVCSGIPGAKSQQIPRFACLDKFSIVERHGHVFVHTEANVKHTLPFFTGEEPADFACARVREITGKNHWSVATANAFDLAHFEYVHQRRPVTEPTIHAPHADAQNIKLDYEIHGKVLADRFLVKRFGRRAQLDYTVWHGNLIFAVTRIGSFINRMMVFVHPTAAGFEAKLFVFTPTSRSPIKRLARELSAHFSQRFFAQECAELEGVAIDPQRMGPNDRLLAQYVQWLQSRAIKDTKQSPPLWADLPLASTTAPTELPL